METVKLSELVDIYLGLTHTPEYVLQGVPFLSVKDISNGKIDFSKCNYITKEEYNSLPNGAKPQTGDMLFCRVGTIGKPVIIEPETPRFGSFVSLGFFRLKSNNLCKLKYLYYWMYSNSFFSQVKQNVKGASQVNLNTGWLSKFDVPLCSIEEQEDIICKLEYLDNLSLMRKQQLSKLDELVKSRFIELFGNDDYPSEPLNNNIIEMFIGPFGSSLKNEYFVDKSDGYCMVYEQKHAIQKTMSVPTRYVPKSKYEELKRFTVFGGDIIVSCRGTIGEVFTVPFDAPMGIMHPSIMKIRLDTNKYNQKFFVFALEQYMNEHNAEAKGSGVKMAVSATVLGQSDFVIPPMDVQNQFATFVEQTDKLKCEVKESLEKLETLKKSLMQKYFG